MNGGLCDFTFNFKDLSNELSKTLEFNKIFTRLMNLVDLDILSKLKEDSDHKIAFVRDINNFEPKHSFFFNEDAVCGIIKTGTIFKLCSDYIEQSIQFMKMLLNEKYASNKILSKFYN